MRSEAAATAVAVAVVEHVTDDGSRTRRGNHAQDIQMDADRVPARRRRHRHRHRQRIAIAIAIAHRHRHRIAIAIAIASPSSPGYLLGPLAAALLWTRCLPLSMGFLVFFWLCSRTVEPGKDDGTSGFFRREEGVFVFLRKVFGEEGRRDGWCRACLEGEGARRAAPQPGRCVWSAFSLSPTHPHPHAHSQRPPSTRPSLTLSAALFFFFSSAARVGRKDSDDEILQVRSKFSRDFSSATAGSAWQATKGRNRVGAAHAARSNPRRFGRGS